MSEVLHSGYGAQLAQARQALGLTQAEVASKLKITQRQVEAMEAEDTAHLPGDLFLRGFVRNYARLVGLDPERLIAPLDAAATVSATITAHSEGVAMGTGGLKRWLVVPAILLALFVVVVALLYQWLRQGEEALVPETAEKTVALPAEPAQQPAAPAPAVQEQPAPVVAAPEVATVPVPTSEPVAPSVPVLAKPLPITPPEPPSENKPGAVEGHAAGAHVLRFKADQDAWVQVVDGKGRRFSKLVRAGGSDSITGEPPFKLVVGEAAQVSLSYDGRAIDLAPFIGQKVARLTLE